MYIFKMKVERLGKAKGKHKYIEIEGFYDLGEAWHCAIDKSIELIEDDERLIDLELIAY